MKKTYMLDTNICSFIMRERPLQLLKILQKHVEAKNRIVASAITYVEMRFGAMGKKSSPKHNVIVDEFMLRIESVLPWDKEAVDATTKIKKHLNDSGTPIGTNDNAIAGHAIAAGCVLVTNNTKEFERVSGLNIEDWTE